MPGLGTDLESVVGNERVEPRARGGLDFVGALDMLGFEVVADIGVDALVAHRGDRAGPFADMGDRDVGGKIRGDRARCVEHGVVGLRLDQQSENGPCRHRTSLPRKR